MARSRPKVLALPPGTVTELNDGACGKLQDEPNLVGGQAGRSDLSRDYVTPAS